MYSETVLSWFDIVTLCSAGVDQIWFIIVIGHVAVDLAHKQ
jgi:hypothetical protein